MKFYDKETGIIYEYEDEPAPKDCEHYGLKLLIGCVFTVWFALFGVPLLFSLFLGL